jgi:putative sugar O-methyltransferase
MNIPDDPELLNSMLADGARQSQLYKPGPYWSTKSQIAARQIKRLGLSDFRGASSLIGVSLADSIHVDTRNSLDLWPRWPLKFVLEKAPLLSTFFNAQVELTRAHAAEAQRLRARLITAHPRTHELLSRYRVPMSTLGGCGSVIDGGISTDYLTLLDQHDHVSDHFRSARSLFEIGGGYGANVHLLIENYPLLRKIVYLDIPPNLYVGTQYLKAFYGRAVRDYRETRGRAIRFDGSGDLEIVAVAPWQIELLEAGVDVFYNAHSFAEMSPAVVENYAKRIDAKSIVLVTYDHDDPARLKPDRLPRFFRRDFEQRRFLVLDGSFETICYCSI